MNPFSTRSHGYIKLCHFCCKYAATAVVVNFTKDSIMFAWTGCSQNACMSIYQLYALIGYYDIYLYYNKIFNHVIYTLNH